jgi:hypothetical protein
MHMDREDRRVTRAIKRALALIAEQDLELARLLEQTIKTGKYLSYSPASPQPAPRRKSQGTKKTPRRQGKSLIQPGRK